MSSLREINGFIKIKIKYVYQWYNMYNTLYYILIYKIDKENIDLQKQYVI